MIKGSEDRNLFSCRSPDGKIGSFHSLYSRGVSTEFVIEVKVGSFVKQIEIVRAETADGFGRGVVGLGGGASAVPCVMM